MLHSKRGAVTKDAPRELKSDLNLVRIKWKEMNHSFNPKFFILCEHTPYLLLQMNGFFDIVEDVIERWNQARMRCHSRIEWDATKHQQMMLWKILQNKLKRIVNESLKKNETHYSNAKVQKKVERESERETANEKKKKTLKYMHAEKNTK